MFSATDTIVAIATPPGRGGIGVVRIAGPEAEAIAGRLLGRTRRMRPRVATFGTAHRDGNGQRVAIDQVVATWFRAPHSYTGDDVVEIGAHGSPPVLRQLVEEAVVLGARPAGPGEFTFRAYLNGRLDLAQAEAVADLIGAVTPLQARAAMDQLGGTLTLTITAIDAALFDLAARLEASLDFPEEGFHFVTSDEACAELQAIATRLDDLVHEGRRGRIVREGALVVLAGRPNVGKSSLFNALAGGDRAIVTDVPGTTRDVLSETIDIGGLAVTLVDTAGVHDDSQDAIEREGVRRARAAHAAATVVLVVLDGSTPLTAGDRALLQDEAGGARLVVVNKTDQPRAWSSGDAAAAGDAIAVSARSGAGLDRLRQGLIERLTGHDQTDEPPAITNIRHLAQVEAARAAVGRAMTQLADGATEELVLAELTGAREALEAVAGRRAPDELLHHVFARFCVGK